MTEAGVHAKRTRAAVRLAAQSATSTGALSTHDIRVCSFNAGHRTLKTIPRPTDPFRRGPAVTGTESALVVAETGVANGKVMWFDGTRGSPPWARARHARFRSAMAPAIGPQRHES